MKRFNKTIFRNGLTLVTEKMPGTQSVCIGVWVKVGTRHEQKNEAGLSHFLEHMVFKGTKYKSALELSQEIEQVGGEFNAYTTREYTCFHITLLAKDAGLALNILGDIILNSNFNPTEFQRERQVVLQEIAEGEDDHAVLVQDLYWKSVYGKSGLGALILGTESSIKKTSRKDLVRFFQRHYRPEKVLISVAGNISHENIKRKLKKFTGHWPNRDKTVAKPVLKQPYTKPKFQNGCWWAVKKNAEQVHIQWGVESVNYSSKDRFAAYLLSYYLGGGTSSALYQEVREKQALAYSVFADIESCSDAGFFSASVSTKMNNVTKCLNIIENKVKALQSTPLNSEELKNIKDTLKGKLLLLSGNVEVRMSSIAKNLMFLGQTSNIKAVCRQIDAVTPEDIQKIAQKMFRRKRSILLLGPPPSKQLKAKLKPQFLDR